MSVVLHSARSIFYLLAANCFFGMITASFCSLIDDIERFVVLLPRKRFISYRNYISLDIKNLASKVFVDISSCLIAASFMLFTAFIYNSGNFRLVSIPALFIGFALGKRLLCRVIKQMVNRLLFCFKWIFDIAFFPILWLFVIVSKLVSNVIQKANNRRRMKILTKYTDYCFAHINDESKYGLLDDYYKELENERTV